MASTIILSDNGVSSGSAGLKETGGNDGVLLLQTTTAGGTATTAVTIGTDQSVTFAQGANLPNTFGFKNRIMNGAMLIDQRNAGAAVSTSSNYVGAWSVDRFAGVKNGAGVFSLQQNSSAPNGFTSSIKALVTTADASIASDDFAFINQVIEGYNVADFGFGAAGASTVTLSFWVKSNLTGTYSAVIVNGTGSRSYVSNYTINSANTWEQKTITVAGDTAGTWDKTNGAGFIIRFGLAAGSGFQQAAGSWGTGNAMGTSSNVNWLGTLNNDFYITGVQLEKGSTATSFDFRPFGAELQLCQRYYQKTCAFFAITAPATQTDLLGAYSMYVPMRATPTATADSGLSFHRPGIAFYAITSVVGVQNANGQGYTTLTIATGAGTSTSGQVNGSLLLSAEL